MDIKFDWVKPQKGRGGNRNAYGIRSYRADYNDTNGNRRVSTLFRLCRSTMKRARFVVGDRIQVGTALSAAGEELIAIRRVVEGGFTISSSDKGKVGTAETGTIKMSVDNLPLGEWPIEKIHMTSDGVLYMKVSDAKT